MPPRMCLRLCAHAPSRTASATYASIATTTSAAAAAAAAADSTASLPILRYPPTQPPSHRPAEFRKTQLHRQYQSLLKSSPVLLIFQHNNIKAVEWMSIRRELAAALQKLDDTRATQGQEEMASQIKLQIIRTNIFASALRVVEFYQPELDLNLSHSSTVATTTTTTKKKNSHNAEQENRFTHGLSRQAYEMANDKKLKLELQPVLSGPLAVATFPKVVPQYLKTVLSILVPSKPDFPAPSRKASPDYYEPSVQAGLQKLMLLGARIEGEALDMDGTKWVAGMDGGIEGLRAQLAHTLLGVGANLTNVVESASRNLYFTLEARRLDQEAKQ